MVRAVAVLAAVLVAAIGPGPALAASPAWQPIACFSGAIDSIEVVDRGGAFVTLSGHLDCGAYRKGATFGYARFSGGAASGDLPVANLRRYADTSPTLFSEGRYLPDGPVDLAICVVTDYEVRIGCVGMLRTDDEPLLVTQLSADKAVAYDLPIQVVVGEYRPACGGCW
jgi:hypothetical protein